MSAPAPSSLAIVDAEPLPRQDEVLTEAALARGERLRDLSVTRPSLEDIYLELTEDG